MAERRPVPYVDPIPRMNLGVFHPVNARPHLCSYATMEVGLVPSTRRISTLRQLTDIAPVGIVVGTETQTLLDRANTEFYAAMQRFYGLGDSPPIQGSESRRGLRRFYDHQFQVVGTQINSMVKRYIPAAQRDRFEVPGAYQYPPEPAQLYQTYVSVDTKEKERYEMGRQIALAIIAGELDANADRINTKLGLVQSHLLPDLFGPLRERRDVSVYALHDTTTNQVRWISTRPQDEIDSELAERTHLKLHERGVYEVEGIGPVQYRSRVKGPPGVIKAVKKALINAERGDGDLITPLESVPDIMGMEFVVHDAFSSFDPKVGILIERVKDSLKHHLHLTEDNFEEKSFKNGEKFKGFFQGRRLMVSFPDLEGAYLEFMFHGLGDHLNNTHNVGTANKGRRKDYQAHAVMEVERDISVLQLLFPEKYYGKTDWEKIVQDEIRKEVTSLKRGNIVDPSEKRIGLAQGRLDQTKSRVILID